MIGYGHSKKSIKKITHFTDFSFINRNREVDNSDNPCPNVRNTHLFKHNGFRE